jgi:hypothetical protein
MAYPEGEEGVIDLGHRNFIRPLGPSPDCFMHWHDCPGQTHVSWSWFGDCGEQKSGHKILTREPLTVQGSLACKHCSNHGFIENGCWRPA